VNKQTSERNSSRRDGDRGSQTCEQGRLRILVIAPSFDILGGQTIQAARLIEGLAAEPSVSVGFLPINPRVPSVLRWLQKIKFVRTVVTTLLYLSTLLIRVRKYDVLHIFSASYYSFMLSPTPALLAGKLFGRRTVLNYHSGQASDHLTRFGRTAIPTIRLADRLVVPSGYLVEVFARFGLKAHPIFNHLDLSRFKFRERRNLRPVFLSNRNLEPLYNVGCVLRAFAIVQASFADASLTVVGDGSQRHELELLSRELGLRNIRFAGHVAPEEMPVQYDAADLYLNASDVDNMPLSILEAFASGLPVVTSNAGGIPYMVKHEETALMVHCGDHEAIAASAVRLLEEPETVVNIVANARGECRKYSWTAVRAEWLDLYAQLASKEQVKDSTAAMNKEEIRKSLCEQPSVQRLER
jgi:glycosyltransferase involved in cell wall biosynthesis